MKTAIVIALAVLAQALGNTILSKGMKTIAAAGGTGGFSPMMLVDAMANPLIWLGTILLVLFFALFAAALSWEDLSFVLPATAFGYILNVLLAWHFLNEPVSPARWAGTVFIFAGVILVSGSGGKRPSEPVLEETPGCTGHTGGAE